jgi:hypothetical protein
MPEVPLREIPTLDEVERQLVQMWSELAKVGKAVLRAGKMNLVVVPAPGDTLAALLEDLGKVTDMSPGRVLRRFPPGGGGRGQLHAVDRGALPHGSRRSPRL